MPPSTPAADEGQRTMVRPVDLGPSAQPAGPPQAPPPMPPTGVLPQQAPQSVSPSQPMPPAMPFAAPPAAPPTGQSLGGPAPVGPPRPAMANPFAGVTLRDVLTDVGAAILLLTTLAMPWNLSSGGVERANEHWWVVLSLVVSLFSLPVPYVGRSGIIPAMTPAWSRLLKLALAAPLTASLLAVLVVELANVTDSAEGGIGTGVAMALVAGLLAVQPRSYDDSASEAGIWRAAQSVLIGSGAVLLVLTWLIDCVRLLTSDYAGFLDAGQVALEIVSSAALVIIPWAVIATAYQRVGRPIALRLLTTAIITYLAVGLIGQYDGTGDVPLFFSQMIEKLSHEPGFFSGPQPSGVFLLAAGVAVLASKHGPQDDHVSAAHWIGTARAAGLYLGSCCVALVIIVMAHLGINAAAFDADLDLGGEVIAALVLIVIAGILGVAISLVIPRRDLPAVLPVILAGVWLVLGLVCTGLLHGGSLESGFVTVFTGMGDVPTYLMFGGPILVLVALIAPPVVRRERGPLLPSLQQSGPGRQVGFPGQPPAYGQQPPPPAPPAPPAPPSGW